jgi:hypothetical protein
VNFEDKGYDQNLGPNINLVLGLSFGDALTLGFYLTIFHHIKTNMGNSFVPNLSFGNAPTLGFYLNFFII